jgi:hypothetical protein
MKKETLIKSLGGLLLAVVFISAPVFSARSEAQNKVIPIEGVGYNVNASMVDNLKSLTGKVVYISLDSGKTYTGLVKAVGDHLVHIERLEGKEYFDALISIESIRAIDTRFRDYPR